jgi:hypothetical protein
MRLLLRLQYDAVRIVMISADSTLIRRSTKVCVRAIYARWRPTCTKSHVR